jgi:hypothetical protein
MVSLLDIQRRTKTVPTDAGDISVYAVSAAGITSIMSLVPTVRKLMAGTSKPEDLSLEALVGVAPDFIAGVIAAGVDKPGDPDTLKAAAGLALETQVDLVKAIVEVTMPKGIGPFMESVSGIMGALASANGGKAPVTK